MKTYTLLSSLITLAGKGSEQGKWLAAAFLSWHEGMPVDLRGVENLDVEAFKLFLQMLALRRQPPGEWGEKDLAACNQSMQKIMRGEPLATIDYFQLAAALDERTN